MRKVEAGDKKLLSRKALNVLDEPFNPEVSL